MTMNRALQPWIAYISHEWDAVSPRRITGTWCRVAEVDIVGVLSLVNLKLISEPPVIIIK
jgi:hypothetical protein